MPTFTSSVEFYIILTIVAAAVAALMLRPPSEAPVEEYLLPGDLSESPGCPQPSIRLECLADNTAILTRCGAPGALPDGAVSIAVTVKGADVTIEERIVASKGAAQSCCDAAFLLKFLRPGRRYHVKYNSNATGTYAVFRLHVAAGLKIARELHN